MRTGLAIVACAAALLAQGTLRRAPGWALVDTRMEIHDLADYRGKIVLLEFMQTTCPHCLAFTETLHQVEQKYGNKVQVISIVKAPEENGNTVAAFVSKYKIDYPVLFDAGQMAFSYVRSGTLEYPHLYVIDGNGFIRHDHLYGPTTKEVFEGKALFAEIDKLLAR